MNKRFTGRVLLIGQRWLVNSSRSGFDVDSACNDLGISIWELFGLNATGTRCKLTFGNKNESSIILDWQTFELEGFQLGVGTGKPCMSVS